LVSKDLFDQLVKCRRVEKFVELLKQIKDFSNLFSKINDKYNLQNIYHFYDVNIDMQNYTVLRINQKIELIMFFSNNNIFVIDHIILK
jgi:hypothetical protein